MHLQEITKKIDEDRKEACKLIKLNLVEQASIFDNIRKLAFMCYNKNCYGEISNYDLSTIFKKNKIKLCNEIRDSVNYEYFGKNIYFNIETSRVEYETGEVVKDKTIFKSFSYRSEYFNIESIYENLKVISERPFDDLELLTSKFRRRDDRKTIMNFGEYFLNKAASNNIDITLEDIIQYTKGSQIIQNLTQEDYDEMVVSSKVNSARRALRR